MVFQLNSRYVLNQIDIILLTPHTTFDYQKNDAYKLHCLLSADSKRLLPRVSNKTLLKIEQFQRENIFHHIKRHHVISLIRHFIFKESNVFLLPLNSSCFSLRTASLTLALNSDFSTILGKMADIKNS